MKKRLHGNNMCLQGNTYQVSNKSDTPEKRIVTIIVIIMIIIIIIMIIIIIITIIIKIIIIINSIDNHNSNNNWKILCRRTFDWAE